MKKIKRRKNKKIDQNKIYWLNYSVTTVEANARRAKGSYTVGLLELAQYLRIVF